MTHSPMLYDITPPITPELQVFPGDTPPSREVLLDMARGDHLTLSTLHTTVHLGAHVDAASHYGDGAPTMEAFDLNRTLGPAQVMHVRTARGARIAVEDLTAEITAPRVLLRTDSFPDPTTWTTDFCGIDPALVDHFAERDVCLVGLDTPSVDVATARNLAAHHRFLHHDISILEGIVLTDVPDGLYELIALPLRLVGFDASPVRAVLRPLTERSSPR